MTEKQEMAVRVRFEVFRSPVNSWKSLFEQAANFATLIGKDRVINISHSWGVAEGLVTVWYRSDELTNVLGLASKETES